MTSWLSCVRKLLWAGVLGLVSGGACCAVRLGFRELQYLVVREHGLLPMAAAGLRPPLRIIAPIAGACLAMSVAWMGRRYCNSEDVEEYVEAVRFGGGRIGLLTTAWRTLSAAFSIATGAAVGREGIMIQFAAAATSSLGERVKISNFLRSRQVACGVAAAVAAAYNAPFAGVCFASEIVLGRWIWSEMPNLTVASFTGWMVGRVLLRTGPMFAVHEALRPGDAAWGVLLVVVLALLGPIYQAVLKSLAGLRMMPLSLMWGGVVVGLLSCRETMVWGNGDVALATVLSGKMALDGMASVLLYRLLATTVCVGAGTVGGVFTPTLFTGAALGMAFGSAVHVAQPVLFAVLGVSIFLAAVTHASWLAAFVTVELTGQWQLLPMLLIASFAASALSRRLSERSLYSIAELHPLQNEALANP